MKLLIVDLEATCWMGEPEKSRIESEIIEIGAVLYNTEEKVVFGEFQSFVQPERNLILSPFCNKLTSIVQSQVDSAKGFKNVFKAFKSFWEYAGDFCTWCSWGDYDKNQLRRDCEFHDIDFFYGSMHVNMKKVFNRQYGKKKGVKTALEMLGLEFEGNHHRAIDDSRMVARICEHIDDKHIKEYI